MGLLSYIARKIQQRSSAPATCLEGDVYYNTISDILFVATGTNTWTPVASTGGGTGIAANSIVKSNGTVLIATSGITEVAGTTTINSGGSSSFLAGDVNVTANGTILTLDDTAKTITLSAGNGAILSGVSTNSSAAAGQVGEFITGALAAGSATSLTTVTPKTIISISLTAGDWDVWGVVDYIPAATTTTAFVQQGSSTVNNTLGAADTFTACSGGNLSGSVLGSLIAENIPTRRISLASTTTVYLVANASFAVSTMTAYGSIFARRKR